MLKNFSRQPGAGGGGGGITAAKFDGATQLRRGAALTGAAGAYTQALFSAWMKFAADPAGSQFQSSAAGKYIGQGAGPGAFWHSFLDAGGLDDTFKFAGLVNGTWAHLMLAYDSANHPGCLMYLNGVANGAITFASTGSTLAGETNFLVGGAQVMEITDFYLGFGQWMDLSVLANRQKFYNGGRVSLGANGQTPTGVSPTIYMTGNAANFVTNRGSGGAFATALGAVLDAGSNPP
jgi:hypothetical protein